MVAVQVFPLFLQSCLVKLFLRIASMGCMRVRELFLVFVSFQFVFLLSSWTFGWIVLPWLANVFSSRCRCYVNFLVSLQFSLICLFMVLTTTTHRSCKTVFFYTLDFCPSPNFINFFISRFTFLCRSNSLSLGFLFHRRKSWFPSDFQRRVFQLLLNLDTVLLFLSGQFNLLNIDCSISSMQQLTSRNQLIPVKVLISFFR